MNIVIVGHIDHGKSTLIGRLLYDTNSIPQDKIEEIKEICKAKGKKLEFSFFLDYLQEEREQGITIDSSRIFFKTKKRDYTIIDSPGHVEFIKNMITGASKAEAAILIIDAKEGIKEQTKRHAYILSLLGLNQTTVVINKMDLIDYKENRFLEIKDKLTKVLESIGITSLHFVPIVATDGENIVKKSENMPWYNGKTLIEYLDSFKQTNKHHSALRFVVQGTYKLDKKEIIVGKIESGEIKKGDKITILPNNSKTTVASIEKFLENPNKAGVGESIGITTTNKTPVKRGDIICKEDDMPKINQLINAKIFWMSDKPLNIKDKLNLKLATQEVSATIEKINLVIDSSTFQEIRSNSNNLNNNEVGIVTIKTLNPVVFDDFKKIAETGRFVIEKDMQIVAGGTVTNL